jgi:YD repeat-containing protein
VTSTSTSGVTTSYDYDGLGRRAGVTDPRTGRSVTHYDSVTGRVDYVRDAAGNTTSFGYEPSTGRKISETNALGKTTYFAYDARGQLVQTWGDVPYPVEYVYDEYGRRTEMHTFRDGALSFGDSAWPEGASLVADVNNQTERGIRGPVVGRKNHYGSKSRRSSPGSTNGLISNLSER